MIYRRVAILAAIIAMSLFIVYISSSVLLEDKVDKKASDKKRIATFSASITEVIYYLGLEDVLVADTDYCNYPEDAKSKHKIGSLGNINYELLIALDINVAILPSYMHETASILAGYGIDTIIVDHNTIDGIVNSIAMIDSYFDSYSRISQSNDLINKRLKNIEKVRCNSKDKKRILFVVFHDTLENDIGAVTVAANDGYYSDMISRAGGDNIFQNILAPYPEFDKEAIMISNPDIIIELLKPNDDKEHILNEWSKLKDITAVKNNEIYLLDDIAHSIPGPRFIDTLETIASIICASGVENAAY